MLEDTSFAIHPGKKQLLENSSFHDIGSLLSFQQNGQVFEFVTDFASVKIQLYSKDIVRIVMNPFKEASLKSTAAVVLKPKDIETHIIESDINITLKTEDLSIFINKSPFRLTVLNKNGEQLVTEDTKGLGYKENKEVICYKKMDEEDSFYGFGERTGFLNKKGQKMTMWNTDVYATHTEETDVLYVSIPFFIKMGNDKTHGLFFDNPSEVSFDFKTDINSYSFSAKKGQLDYYVINGPTPKDVLKSYTELTGRMNVPPKWAIGYHQSRYSYETESEVRDLVATFKEKDIPLDVVYLDIHYMDEYRVFTFDKDRFPTAEKMIQDLREEGIRIVPIVDPGVKKDPDYYIYQEGVAEDLFSKYFEGNIFYGDVWPGTSAFPDFTNEDTRQWWGDKHRFYTEKGIEGVWNDMNEPSVFCESKTMDLQVMHKNDGEPKTHEELHNLYGLLMGKATYEGLAEQLEGKRPFILTRSGYAGVQRYSTVWTGDNRSYWEHLALALPMCMNLGLSGVAFTGPDVGGFTGDSNGELLARWTQIGAFTPFFRNHSEINSIRQEPWSFGEKYEHVIRKYIKLRYQWLPQLYTLFREASETGLPVMRPLLLEFPEDKNVWNLSDQFMIGNNVLIAPILKPGIDHRMVYLPEGNWVNYWTDEELSGNQYFAAKADIDTLPIFVKRGTIIMLGDVQSSTEKSNETLTLHIYPSASGEGLYTYYEDDGTTFKYKNGEYLLKEIKATFSKNAVDITTHSLHSGYDPKWNGWNFIIHGSHLIDKVNINGKEIQSINRDNSEFQFYLSKENI